MRKLTNQKLKHVLIGKNPSEGLLGRIAIYGLLIIIGFVYLYPLIKMFVYSIKDLEDLVNPTVEWIPTKLYLENYRTSWIVLNYGKTLLFSLLVTLVPAIVQTITTSLTGYALAKFKMKGKLLVFGLILMTYLVPSQVYMIPKFVLFDKFGIL